MVKWKVKKTFQRTILERKESTLTKPKLVHYRPLHRHPRKIIKGTKEPGHRKPAAKSLHLKLLEGIKA